jgi:hypothetical protein
MGARSWGPHVRLRGRDVLLAETREVGRCRDVGERGNRCYEETAIAGRRKGCLWRCRDLTVQCRSIGYSVAPRPAGESPRSTRRLNDQTHRYEYLEP